MKLRRVDTYMSVRFSIRDTAPWFTLRTLARFTCVKLRASRSWWRVITPAASFTRRAISASTSGENVPRISLHFRAMILFSNLLEVLSIDRIRSTDCVDVPVFCSRFIATQNQVSIPSRIECEENPERPSPMLDPQLLHIRKDRFSESVSVRTPQFPAMSFKHLNSRGNTAGSSWSSRPYHSVNSSLTSTSQAIVSVYPRGDMPFAVYFHFSR